MGRANTFKPTLTEKGWMVSIGPSMTASGKRVRKFFTTESAAKKFSASVRSQHAAGMRGSMIPAALAIDAVRAAALLNGTGISIVEAASMAVAKFNSSSAELFGDRYLRTMTAMEYAWSNSYRLSMTAIPRWLPAEFLQRRCHGLDRVAIEAALRVVQPNLKQSSLDMKSTRILAVVNFRPRHRKASAIQILSVSQCARLLRVCESAAERRVVALLLFAGIRPDAQNGEIGRLDWSSVSDQIYIAAEISKTSSDRYIPISARLGRLLRGHPKSGPVCPPNWRRAWQRIRRDAGISEMHDVLRHTFASNYLAAHGEEATKNAMGHTQGSVTLFRHYRRAIMQADGIRFFH